MTEELSEPDYVDFVGVVFTCVDAERKLYTAYRISMVDGVVSLQDIKFGKRRTKKSALRVMALDLVSISQAVTRDEIEFVNADEIELSDA